MTGIAIVLIVVLTTILVAPYFVDWNGQRDFLEARLDHALGQKVTIGGNIDLKLLPTPLSRARPGRGRRRRGPDPNRHPPPRSGAQLHPAAAW